MGMRLGKAALGLVLLAAFLRPSSSNDLGLHLRIGADIAASGRIPRTDAYSFTAKGEPYVDQEWLSQIGMHFTHKAFGPEGLSIATAILAAAALLSVGDPIAMLLAAALASAHFAARPHVLGWAFAAILVRLLRRGPTWSAPALLAPWANCHASCLLGSGIAFLHFAEKRQPRWALASLAAPLFNPYGIGLHLHLLRIRAGVAWIDEWKPFPLLSLPMAVWAAYLALVCLGLRRDRSPWNLLRAALLAVLGTSAMRHAPVAAIYLAPFAAFRLPGRLALGVLASAWGLWLGYACRFEKAMQWGIDPFSAPEKAAEFLVRHDLPGPLFNDYNFGGWLLWKAPGRPVFIDGRTDVYPEEVVREARLVHQAAPGWERVLERRGIATVIIRKDRPGAQALGRHPGWELVYFDYNAAIYVRKGLAPEVRRLVHVRSGGPRDASKGDEIIAELRYLVSENPMHFDAWGNLAAMLQAKGDAEGAREALARCVERAEQRR